MDQLLKWVMLLKLLTMLMMAACVKKMDLSWLMVLVRKIVVQITLMDQDLLGLLKMRE